MREYMRDFLNEWNKKNRITFSAYETSRNGRLTSIEVRYPTEFYRTFYSPENWERLNDAIEEKSKRTMYIATTEHLFERGIIEIKIASGSRAYKERLVEVVLRWLGEEFFPKPKCKNRK